MRRTYCPRTPTEGISEQQAKVAQVCPIRDGRDRMGARVFEANKWPGKEDRGAHVAQEGSTS